MRTILRTMLLLLGALALAPAATANACSRIGPFTLNELFAGDVIVRVTALKYIVMPRPDFRTTGEPDSTVEFRVEEILKGEGVPDRIVLKAYLTSSDDFNETAVPYRFVRPGGRAGSCFANSYKEGAQFLLFLKKTADGYTPNISPLGPTNEQLMSETDPWLLWVRERLNPCGKLGEQDRLYELLKEGESHDIYKVMTDHRSLSVQYRLMRCYIERFETRYGPDDQYIKYMKRWIEKYERDTGQR